VAELGPQLGVELPLDGAQDHVPAGLELEVEVSALLDRAQLRVVQPAGGLFAVAGDEGDGAALAEQAERCAHAGRRQLQIADDRRAGVKLERHHSTA
jgi:hypothetical protein